VTSITQAGVVNQLIERLSARDRERLLDALEPVTLVGGDRLCEAGLPYDYVYFPLAGFVSLATAVRCHPPLEVNLIGNEGMLGATLLSGIEASPLRGVVGGPGQALRMPATQFQRELRVCLSLASVTNRYLYVLLAQLSRTAACTCFHGLEARLARRLLMTHDHALHGSFHLTHQLLADMLGVRRSAVTIAAGALQAAQLVSYSRGEIAVVDRQGLEAAACECYRATVEEYVRQFPPAQ
jgi:CRP-like cAMP-binding protein